MKVSEFTLVFLITIIGNDESLCRNFLKRTLNSYRLKIHLYLPYFVSYFVSISLFSLLVSFVYSCASCLFTNNTAIPEKLGARMRPPYAFECVCVCVCVPCAGGRGDRVFSTLLPLTPIKIPKLLFTCSSPACCSCMNNKIYMLKKNQVL